MKAISGLGMPPPMRTPELALGALKPGGLRREAQYASCTSLPKLATSPVLAISVNSCQYFDRTFKNISRTNTEERISSAETSPRELSYLNRRIVSLFLHDVHGFRYLMVDNGG